ncbi:hypothetical protein GCM10023229_06420 [Flavisolibacter ginsenosidimutans]
MKTLEDAHLIAENDSLWFRGKPLKNLLKEIGPEIKMVSVNGESWAERPALIIFRFVDRSIYYQYRCAEKFPLSIQVRIKESFDWKKSKEDYFKWSKTDTEQLGNLTIVTARVYGEVGELPQAL